MYRGDWRAAGEAAYALLAARQAAPDRRVAHANRRCACMPAATGNYGRAIRALEAWTAVEWEDGEPRLGDPLGQGIATAALADLLRLAGQPERAKRWPRHCSTTSTSRRSDTAAAKCGWTKRAPSP